MNKYKKIKLNKLDNEEIILRKQVLLKSIIGNIYLKININEIKF